MRKIVYICIMIMMLCSVSCTEHSRAKNFGGEMTIVLPVNERLVEATWKNSQLWYLTEPMDSTYIPKRKTFREDSNWGVMEGKVIFEESKNYD